LEEAVRPALCPVPIFGHRVERSSLKHVESEWGEGWPPKVSGGVSKKRRLGVDLQYGEFIIVCA